MKLISNNCAAAYYYKLKNLTYNHPFMWSLIDASEFIEFIKEYDNIHCNKCKLFEMKKTSLRIFVKSIGNLQIKEKFVDCVLTIK